MRALTILLLFTFLSCKNTTSQKKEEHNEPIQNQLSAEKTALDFVNSYIAYCNDLNSEMGLIAWVSNQTNVTEAFKTDLKKIIEDAEKFDPEMGLDFDPILDAQDYPEEGFELDTSENTSNFILVKGKGEGWSDFKLKIKMELKENAWFVNGIGVINMSVNERVER